MPSGYATVFARVACEPEYGVELLSQSDTFAAEPQGRIIRQDSMQHPERHEVKKWQVLIAGAGTLAPTELYGRAIIADERLVGKYVGQDSLIIGFKEPGSDASLFAYAYLASPTGLKALRASSYGTKILRIRRDILAELPVPQPDEATVKHVADLVRKCVEQREASSRELRMARGVLEALPEMTTARAMCSERRAHCITWKGDLVTLSAWTYASTGGALEYLQGQWKTRLADTLASNGLFNGPRFARVNCDPPHGTASHPTSAPHALYVLEAKEWYGRLTGDDTEWLLNQKPKKCPLWLTNTKCKVLKGELGAVGGEVRIPPVLVIPDGTQNLLGGNWGNSVRSLSGTVAYLQDPKKVPQSSDILKYHAPIQQILTGKWGARQRQKRRRIGSYEITETLFTDERSGEHLARHGLLADDPTTYRIRTFRLDQSRPDEVQEKRRAVIRRPTEAVAKIGPHPNLLRVLQFDFLDEESEFFEVTEWSDFGTLHGYLENQERDRLTLRERLSIAEGVAAALEAVHAHDVVHRNVCPETILVGFDRRPRLTDFDRAYVESKYTVLAATEERAENPAYVPPELSDITDYDFDSASDMYSFGVLLYQILLDEVQRRAAVLAERAPAGADGQDRRSAHRTATRRGLPRAAHGPRSSGDAARRAGDDDGPAVEGLHSGTPAGGLVRGR